MDFESMCGSRILGSGRSCIAAVGEDRHGSRERSGTEQGIARAMRPRRRGRGLLAERWWRSGEVDARAEEPARMAELMSGQGAAREGVARDSWDL
eukprot:2546579-Rhodomonas_salina.1